MRTIKLIERDEELRALEPYELIVYNGDLYDVKEVTAARAVLEYHDGGGVVREILLEPEYLPDWRCQAYHVYGDSTDREYSYEELKEYFEITGATTAPCIKHFSGNYFYYMPGDTAWIDKTNRGYLIRNVIK